jgi:hypothetical protein
MIMARKRLYLAVSGHDHENRRLAAKLAQEPEGAAEGNLAVRSPASAVTQHKLA